MNYSDAMQLIGKGKKVRRDGWPGDWQYAKLTTHNPPIPYREVEEVVVFHPNAAQRQFIATRKDRAETDWREVV